MRAWLTACSLVVLLCGAPASAQPEVEGPADEPAAVALPEDPERLAEMIGEADREQLVEIMRRMGIPEGTARLMAVLSASEDMDALPMMLPMDMMGGGRMNGRGLLLAALLFGGHRGTEGQRPVAMTNGEKLYVIDGGTVHFIDLATMELEGAVTYKKRGEATGPMRLGLLLPAIARAREKAVQTRCLSNVRQLCVAALMNAEDWHGTLLGTDRVGEVRVPFVNWVEEIHPYHRDEAILVCPSRPDLPVGYAFNEALLGAKLRDIRRPAETVMFFESDVGGPAPTGGVEALPKEGRHNGGVHVGFVDGHAMWMRLEDARRLLEQPVE